MKGVTKRRNTWTARRKTWGSRYGGLDALLITDEDTIEDVGAGKRRSRMVVTEM